MQAPSLNPVSRKSKKAARQLVDGFLPQFPVGMFLSGRGARMFIVERKGYTRTKAQWAFFIIMGFFLFPGAMLTMHLPYPTKKP
jgi:hypothetical protein